MQKGLLCFHQGWSDIVNCLPLINYYSEQYYSIKLLVREDSKEFVDFYIRDKPKVSVIYKDKEKLPYNCYDELNLSDYDLLYHGYYDCYRNNGDKFKRVFNQSGHFVMGFYTFYGIDYMCKVHKFDFKRDEILECQFYDKFVQNNGNNYSLRHNVNVNGVSLDKLSNNIFATIKVLQNSKELHLSDSVWAALCYLLDARYGLFQNKQVHLYPYNSRDGACCAANSKGPLAPIELKNWIIH